MTQSETASIARILVALLLAAIIAAAGCKDEEAAGPDPEREIEELVAAVRAATQPYHAEAAAVAAGYAPASPCVASPAGGMGIHYANNGLVDGAVDAGKPEMLLYEPSAGGGMELVGVEFMVMADAWDAANGSPPELAGQSFDDHRAEADRHGLPFPHYDLHVWVWKDNPAGVFAPFNPAVSCP